MGQSTVPPASVREKDNLLCDLFRLSDNCKNEAQMLMCDDFNFKESNWKNNTILSTGQTVDTINFLDRINDAFLQQHILVGTHNLDDTNLSNLNLFFSRDSTIS